MKKRKCKKYQAYVASFFFGLIALSNFIGLPQWVKYEGWMEPSIRDGFFFFILSIGIYIYINYACDEPRTMKCKSCKEVFSELDLKEEKCSECFEEMIEVGEYYRK